MDNDEVWRHPEGSRRQGKVERYCYRVICDAPTTDNVKRLTEMRCDRVSTEVPRQRTLVNTGIF